MVRKFQPFRREPPTSHCSSERPLVDDGLLEVSPSAGNADGESLIVAETNPPPMAWQTHLGTAPVKAAIQEDVDKRWAPPVQGM
jgi:hypothetical protein